MLPSLRASDAQASFVVFAVCGTGAFRVCASWHVRSSVKKSCRVRFECPVVAL